MRMLYLLVSDTRRTTLQPQTTRSTGPLKPGQVCLFVVVFVFVLLFCFVVVVFGGGEWEFRLSLETGTVIKKYLLSERLNCLFLSLCGVSTGA